MFINAKKYNLPFMLGVFLLGGGLAIPFMYGSMSDLGYFEALPWSLASCVIFLVAFPGDGTFSWLRCGAAIAVMLVIGHSYTTISGRPAFIAGGILGGIVMGICGLIGMLVGWFVRPINAVGEANEAEEYVCTGCGAQVKYEENVCPQCGADISEIEETEVSQRRAEEEHSKREEAEAASCRAEEAPLTPHELETTAQDFRAHPNKAIIYIIRPAAWGNTIDITLRIDQNILGLLKEETYFVAEVEPTLHKIALFDTKDFAVMEIVMEAGHLYFFKTLAIRSFGVPKVFIDRLSEDQGKELVRLCKRI